METISRNIGENNASINVLTADKALKLNNRNRVLCTLLSLSSLIIIALSFIIGFLVLDNTNTNNNNTKNNQICPESQINMTNSQGQVYNIENYYHQIIQDTNEQLDDTNIHDLVDDLILGLLDSITEPDVVNANNNITNDDPEDIESNNRRRLGNTPQYGGNGGNPFVLFRNFQRITEICINSGSLVDGIQVRFSDGTLSSQVGGSGGIRNCYSSSCFRSVLVRYGSKVDALVLADSTGRMTGYKGGSGGAVTTFNFGSNQCLYQITGRAASLIDAIRFYYN